MKKERGRPKLKESEKKVKFNIELTKDEAESLRKAKETGKIFSMTEAIRMGLRSYLKQIGA